MTKIVSFFMMFGLLFSCATHTKSELETVDPNTSMTPEKWQEEGYTAGQIKIQENSNCPYVILVMDSEVHLDPVNIKEDRFAAFIIDGLNIYFKYRRLRMPNRCEAAQPVELEIIKKRR